MLAWVLTLALFAGVSAQSSRIVGGEITTIENFPSTVQIEHQSGNGVWLHDCAGVILTNLHILSSGFCIGRPWITSRIRAGATHRNVGGWVHYISNVVVHPDNIFNSFVSDIALARTVTPFVYSPTVQQTAIPPQGSVVPDNLSVTKAGWGRIKSGGEFSETLRYVNLLTVNYDICRDILRKNQDFPQMGRDWLCAGLLDVADKGSCFGDFGGPLYYGNLTIGITYRLTECGRSENNITYPSVTTNVAYHTQWIIDNAV